MVNKDTGTGNVGSIVEKGKCAVSTVKPTKEKDVLIESCDKYELELRFKPKHRSKIHQAKENSTFQKWDQQMKYKVWFIP